MRTAKTVPIDEASARLLLPASPVHIGGQFVEQASGERWQQVYPADGKPLGEWTMAGSQEIDRAVQTARLAQLDWAAAAPAARRDVLNRVASAVRARSVELAAMVSLEMGMPIRTSVAGVLAAADWFERHRRRSVRGGRTVPTPRGGHHQLHRR